jgi:hypothetical protein
MPTTMRGNREIDVESPAAKKAREQLAQQGVYSKSLLKTVEAAAE